jgi:threonylcarbamoyladenosine tRNA methylthiotransferase MtaB
MHALRIAFVTFGCRVNQADSLALERRLLGGGATPSPAEDADIVVVNTCSVTASADQGARQTIRRVARLNPRARIVVTGCYATRRPDEVAALPQVVRVVSNRDKDELAAALLRDVPPGLTTAERFGPGEGPCGEAWNPGTGGRTAMTLRVQTGCDQSCSYCIIPSTRGPGRSLPIARVLHDVRRAADAGYKEVVITGVHLGSYGRDLGDGTSLVALLGRLAEETGDLLFRISSLEPMDCTPDVVALVASSPRLAPHFHLPLQHGSDRLLAAMRRPYTATACASLLRSIRARIPHASIGTDLIVGFPGESDADFGETCRLVEDLPVTYLHVFPYSDRPGTEAAKMAPKVDGASIRERGQALRALGHRKAHAFRESQIGAIRRALTVDDGRSAVTTNYLKVELDGRQPRNQWVDVRVEQADPLRARVLPTR